MCNGDKVTCFIDVIYKVNKSCVQATCVGGRGKEKGERGKGKGEQVSFAF